MTRYILCLLGVILCIGLHAQDLEIEGKAKVTTMDTVNSADLVVVRLGDGTLGVKEVSTLTQFQILSISNDTIFLSDGGFVKLPQDEVTDADADPSNELQVLSKSGSTVTLSSSGGSFIDEVDDADADVTNEKITDLVVDGDSLLITEGAITMKVAIDSSNVNEIQAFSVSFLGDTLFISNSNYIIIPGVSFANHTVQEYLDAGLTPCEIFNGGKPLDSLYGKTYAGGLIFFLNGFTCEGYVAAPFDQSTDAPWGCQSELFSGAEGQNLGDGQQNTDDIISGCMISGIAADLCKNLMLNTYSDWFLPSEQELNQMHLNLRLKGYGGFGIDKYWASTKVSGGPLTFQCCARAINFNSSGTFSVEERDDLNSVRAIRKF